MPNPGFNPTQIDYLREGRFTRAARFIIHRTVYNVDYITYLQDVENYSISYDKNMGATTLSLTVRNENGKYNSNSNDDINYVQGIYKPLFDFENRIDVELGIIFPDGSEKWWTKGPFYFDNPEFGQEEGYPLLQVTARDGMKKLLVDIYSGKFEPAKIYVASETLIPNDTRTVYTFAHGNICKVPNLVIKSGGKDITGEASIDYEAGQAYFGIPRDATETLVAIYYYYDMNTNKMGDVIRAILKDAGISDSQLTFVSSDGSTIEPTVGLVEWKMTDNRSHFDCIKDLFDRYMPTNYMLCQRNGIIWGGYAYQKDIADSEVFVKRRVTYEKSDEDLYTQVLAPGIKQSEKNECIGATIQDLYSGPLRARCDGPITNIIDGNVNTQFRYVWEEATDPQVPCDMFKIILPQEIVLGRIEILVGSAEEHPVSIRGSVYVSRDGSAWQLPCSSAKGWSQSSSKWVVMDETDFQEEFIVKYIKIVMEAPGVAYGGLGHWWDYGEFPIREVRVYKTEKFQGKATLWNETIDEVHTIPTSSYQFALNNYGVISHPRLAPRIPSFSLVPSNPAVNEFAVEYGDISTPTILKFNPANAGQQVKVTYAWHTDPLKYDLLNKVGKRTYVLTENPKRNTQEQADQDAQDLLDLVWSQFDRLEVESYWCPWIEPFETVTVKNQQLGLNGNYLVESLEIDGQGTTRIGLANYK